MWTRQATDRVHRFRAAFDHITNPALQQRPRLEMVRVLLASGEQHEAVKLARTADVIRHRAAALDFIAGATRDRAVLGEVIALATDTTELDEQATILRAALQTTGDLGDRAAAELLLRRVHLVQSQLSAEAKRTGDHAKTVHLPQHLRTLTEVAEKLGRFPDPSRWARKGPVVRAGSPPFFAGSSFLSFRANSLEHSPSETGWTLSTGSSTRTLMSTPPSLAN
jgi:hypothetical protein